MADVRDWGKFVRGRWDWHEFGYDRGFPRNSSFGDIDAEVEIDGYRLVLEPKHHDGIGACDYPNGGQLGLLRDQVQLGKVVIVLYGCGVCNSPQAVRVLGAHKRDLCTEDGCSACDRFVDWRGLDLAERRKFLKEEVDRALGLV